jgi:hypothetical protein
VTLLEWFNYRESSHYIAIQQDGIISTIQKNIESIIIMIILIIISFHIIPFVGGEYQMD